MSLKLEAADKSNLKVTGSHLSRVCLDFQGHLELREQMENW